jgi:hypothetical protein
MSPRVLMMCSQHTWNIYTAPIDNKLLSYEQILQQVVAASSNNGIQKISGKLPYKIQYSDIYAVTSIIL